MVLGTHDERAADDHLRWLSRSVSCCSAGGLMRLRLVRWPVVPLLLAVLVLATGSVAVAENSRSAPGGRTATPRPRAMPGTDPAMQRWFLDVDKARIAFNNVLLRGAPRAAAGIGGATGAGTANCSALVAATGVITKVLPALRKITAGGEAVADAYGPSLDAFAAAGSACVKRDFAGAQRFWVTPRAAPIADYGSGRGRRDLRTLGHEAGG